MDRNREAFRKRFLAYKNGKSVGEIYGIPKFEDGRSGKVDWKRWDNAETTPYTIPFIKDKAITLTNAGRATGAKLSTNLLDSLADNAMRAGVPVRTAIGLATKESTLGNPTDDKTAWNQSSAIRKLFNGQYPGTWLHINRGENIDGNSLINYYKGNLHPGGMKKSTIQQGIEFYKQHPDKYNPGQPGYQKAVEARGNEVMESPEVLKWYKEWEKDQMQIMRPEPYLLPTILSTTPNEFGKYANGKLPGYDDGKVTIGHNVSNAKLNDDGTFTDDYTRTFEDMIVTPKRTELKRGSYSANNWNYAKAHRKDWMKTHWPSAVVDDKPLEEVYPEFDLLLGGRQAVTSLAPKRVTPVKQSEPVDKYALDWLNWSRGGLISLEHLKEYANIINTHKDTPNWLLMDDGSYFRGDPRSWVQLMSESAKKAGLRERTFPSYTNIGYSGVDRKINPAYSGIQWFSRNPLVGRSFAANDAHVLEMAYPWPKHVSTLDAGRNYWPAIFKTDSGRLLETNHVVDASTNAISPLEIKNVYELGPNFILKSKYKTPEFNYGTDIVSDDIILYPNYPRKSILYNNGDFDIANPNMYYKDGKLPKYGDGIIPVTTGGTGMPAPQFYGGISEEARPTADALERIANFAPYVGTILDVLEVINGNLAKTPSAVIGAVADVALPGLRTAWKGIKAAKTAVLSAPMLIDKIKNYKLLQKLQKKFTANLAYQGIGTYQDVLDDQGYIKSTKKK